MHQWLLVWDRSRWQQGRAEQNCTDIYLTVNEENTQAVKFYEKLGIKVKIDVMPPSTLRQAIATNKVPFFRGSWIADYPDAENYLSLFKSIDNTRFCA